MPRTQCHRQPEDPVHRPAQDMGAHQRW
jgi:hypothetical protein